ncbi:HEAT repeat domain-containing protein [Clostridium sp. BSD9I1]|uniref:HEAT repeat domain-containing protein n=1 Tax=Clostridium sp. BSD9I1 TaxID=2003589 RepID=UPI001645DE77|nr:helix-turn-helix domain-containing protein [Clostridium sp. BSD9I1]
MSLGFVKVNWDDIDSYSNEEITYFLFLEGKSINAICKMRNLDKSIVQKHIVEGKIKYRLLARSSNEKELIHNISKAGKMDKLDIINSLDEDTKNRLIQYIKNNYVDMYSRDKETAIWIIGELKETGCNEILTKASVHKFVNVRRMAISAMRKINDKSFERALIRALEDENPQVLLYAIKGLAEIKSDFAKGKILDVLQKTDKEYLKKACEVFLSEKNNSEQE